MKLYHFLSTKWALKALENQRIKVSNYESLNDPFELLAMSMRDPVTRRILKEYKRRINQEFRLLSCSRSWHNPLLWSHYAEKHNGIALAFEVPEKAVTRVKYSKKRIKKDLEKIIKNINNTNEKLLWDVFNTKFADWSYESESRIFFLEKDIIEDRGTEFSCFDEDLDLTGIYLGPLNTLSSTEIASNLPKGKSIDVLRTRSAFNSFRIVKNQSKPTEIVKGTL